MLVSPSVGTVGLAVLDPPCDRAMRGPATNTRPKAPSDLVGLSVVIAVLGSEIPSGVVEALKRAGVSASITSDLTEARRSTAALSGPSVTVLFEPPVITGSLRVGVRLLSRHGAVVVVSSRAGTRERIDLLNSGADIVLPPVEPDEVVAVLASVMRRSQTPVEAHTTERVRAGDIRVDRLQRNATAAGRTLALTPLEFDLLAYFVARAGEALSRDQLLVNVWGYDIGGRETVTVHGRRLREKLETDPSRPTRLQTVWGIGYRLIPDAASPSIAGPICSSNGRSVASAVSEQAAT